MVTQHRSKRNVTNSNPQMKRYEILRNLKTIRSKTSTKMLTLLNRINEVPKGKDCSKSSLSGVLSQAIAVAM